MSSIGKTTVRISGQPRPLAMMKRLHKERRERKRDFETENSPREKGTKLQLYKDKQAEVNAQAQAEEEDWTSRKIDRISKDSDGI